MAFDWRSATVGDFVDLQRGNTYQSALLDKPGPVLLGLASIERDGGFRSDKLRTYGGESPAKLLVYPGDMYVSLKDVTQSGDLLGSVARVPSFIAVGRMTQDTVKLVFRNELIDRSYLYWVLRTPEYREYCRARGMGTTNLSLSRDDFLSFPVPEPTSARLSIQRALDAIESKIALNRNVCQTLEAMAQAIFKSWFVDFDPVKAKIAARQEGRDPLRAAMSAISGKPDAALDALPPEQYAQLAATAALFPDEMEESELGEIPRGWEINCISQFGDVVCGKTPSKANPEYFGDGIPFIKIPDMHNSMYVVSPSERLTTLGASSQAKKTIPSGSICISCIATVGKVVITHEPSQTNQQINSIVPKFSQYTAYLYFQMAEKKKEFHDLASGGSATLNMNTSTFSKVSVLMPNFEILTKFSVLVAPLFGEILLRQKESAILSETRDTLLPKLLSGELSVENRSSEPEVTP